MEHVPRQPTGFPELLPVRPTVWKRPLDLVLASILLILLLPVMACLALLVRLESPGPAFYRQERIGRHGRPFRMWKFRSMRVGSHEGIHQQLASQWFAGQESVRGYKSLGDERVTRVGGLLRRTSLDELPQLFNVLRSEMSLVGPRPAIQYELAHYLPWYFERQRLPPGMTGLWQICGRDLVSAEEMMRLDVRYVKECSPWLDLKILALTAPALVGDWMRARQRSNRSGTEPRPRQGRRR